MTPVLIAAAVLFFAWVLARAAKVAREALQEQSRPTLAFDDADLLDLVAEKRQTLAHLKEGELDFETGKVSEDDYVEVRADNAAEAIDVMKRLDEVRAGLKYGATIERDLAEISSSDGQPSWAAKAEEGVAAPPGVLLSGDGEPRERALLAAARVRRARQAGPACPACSAPTQTGDKFCPACGGALNRSCAKCGVALRAGTRFCHECGAPAERAGEPA